ncbi:MAG: CapA family protein [Thermoplasmatales archaeon]|nr:CapA family protein [Thermoplasmatales archaeon]
MKQISLVTGHPTTEMTSNETLQVKIAVAGDTIMAREVISSAVQLMNSSITDPYERVASGFEGLFSKEVKENISSADLAFCNLETNIAEGLTKEWYLDENDRPLCKKINVEPGIIFDGKAYTGGVGPRSTNTHPAFALALKNVGFDIVSTANNHYNNRGSNGIDATIDSLRKVNLDFIGTLRYDEIIDHNEDGYPDNEPYTIKVVNGIKIAFLAITAELDPFVRSPILLPFHVGKLGPADEFCSRQIYYLSSNNAPIEYNIKKFCNGIEKAKNLSDIVVVSAHFGIYKRHEPSNLQKKLAQRFLESGADVIVGHGTHVLQPIDTYNTDDGRKTFIIYNLGNILYRGGYEPDKFSNQLVSIIGFINIVKNSNGVILVHNISYIPIFSYENQDNITSIIVAKGSEFEKTRNIIQIVFERNTMARIILSHYYLTDFKKRLTYINDFLLECIIYKRWISQK